MSDLDRSDDDWAVKLARYQVSGVREVVRFDPENEQQPIRVWDDTAARERDTAVAELERLRAEVERLRRAAGGA